MKKKYVVFVALFAVFAFFSHGVNAEADVIAEYVGNEVAKETVTFGDNVVVDCYMDTFGWMGYSFSKAETTLVEGAREYVTDSLVTINLKERSSGKVISSIQGNHYLNDLDSHIHWWSYKIPKYTIPNTYILETTHSIKDKQTQKWYSYKQIMNVRYDKLYYWHDTGFKLDTSIIK